MDTQFQRGNYEVVTEVILIMSSKQPMRQLYGPSQIHLGSTYGRSRGMYRTNYTTALV